MSNPQSKAEDSKAEDSEDALECDFCGKRTPTVRRVALDGDYERLRTRHPVRFACLDCSALKERSRESAGEP